MPKIDIAAIEPYVGTGYPETFAPPCAARETTLLGPSAGLSQFGVNLMRLAPGVWSSQRHWHTHEDEFVYVLEGEAVLVLDESRETFHAGDCIGFPAGAENGHHFINESKADVVLLTVGAQDASDAVIYPDIDLHLSPDPAGSHTGRFERKDGTPY